MALGILLFCRVPRERHSANNAICREPPLGTRYSTSLPSAAPRALGKACYVHLTRAKCTRCPLGRYSLPSAATEHSVFLYFAECLHKGTQQTWSRAVHEPVTVGGPWRLLLFAECLIYCTRQTWSRVVHVPITIGGPSRPFFFAESQKSGT